MCVQPLQWAMETVLPNTLKETRFVSTKCRTLELELGMNCNVVYFKDGQKRI